MSVTRERDLRTGHTLWEDSAQTGVSYKGLETSISVEVAIIGAGITGALMAHALAGDHEVVVLDRRDP